MAEKKRNWDEWIGKATMAFGPAAMAIEKIKRDARNEVKAASFPERPTTYSRTTQERKQEITSALREGRLNKLKNVPPKSGSIGRESAEMARERKRMGY